MIKFDEIKIGDKYVLTKGLKKGSVIEIRKVDGDSIRFSSNFGYGRFDKNNIDFLKLLKKEKLINENIDLTEKYKNINSVKKVIRNRNTMIVILNNGKKGIAKCNTNLDTFDERIGFNIAYWRARGGKVELSILLKSVFNKPVKKLKSIGNVNGKIIKNKEYDMYYEYYDWFFIFGENGIFNAFDKLYFEEVKPNKISVLKENEDVKNKEKQGNCKAEKSAKTRIIELGKQIGEILKNEFNPYVNVIITIYIK